MNLLKIKLAFACLVFFAAFIAGRRVFRKHDEAQSDQRPQFNKTAQAFACGVFLGAGLLHMLGESSREFYQLGYSYPLANLITGAIFLAFLWLEHIGREIFQSEGKRGAHFALLAVFMLSIHSFFEGAAIGLTLEYPLLITIALAILAHKWAASFSLSVQIGDSMLGLRAKHASFILFCLMTPFGIMLGQTSMTQMTHIELFIPCLNAAAAGTFLYLGTLHGLDYAVMVKKCCHLREFAFLVFGFIVMGLVAIYT